MIAPKRNETPLEYWISLWPAAPMFGVKYRFDGMIPGVAFFKPLDVAAQVARAGAEEAGRVVREQTEAAAAALEASMREASAVAEKFVDASTDVVMAASVIAAEAAPVGASSDEAPDGKAPAPEVQEPEVMAADGVAPDVPAAFIQEPLLGVEFAAPGQAVEDADAAPVAPSTLYDAPPVWVDDLKLIKGVGPKLEQMLNSMGIYRFDQIAGFSPENLAWVDNNLTSFKGRPLRDDWVAQARALL